MEKIGLCMEKSIKLLIFLKKHGRMKQKLAVLKGEWMLSIFWEAHIPIYVL